MPTAKPKYDKDGSWKEPRQFDEAGWEQAKQALQKKLRPFFPDWDAKVDPTFGHPADEWANSLLAEAWSAVSMMLWLRLRLTNEELRAERTDVLAILRKCDQSLSTLSHDFVCLLGIEADVLGCRDKVRALIPFIEATQASIAQLPRARRLREVKHKAAVEMATRVLRALKDSGLSIKATARNVKILKAIGDTIGLVLSEVTWKDIIIKAGKPVPLTGPIS